MSIFGNRLKEQRKKIGLTQTELGVKLDLKLRMIQYLESGDREPNIDTIIKISDTFGCTVDYLLGRTESPHVVIDDSELLDKVFSDLEVMIRESAEKGDIIPTDDPLLDNPEKLMRSFLTIMKMTARDKENTKDPS